MVISQPLVGLFQWFFVFWKAEIILSNIVVLLVGSNAIVADDNAIMTDVYLVPIPALIVGWYGYSKCVQSTCSCTNFRTIIVPLYSVLHRFPRYYVTTPYERPKYIPAWWWLAVFPLAISCPSYRDVDYSEGRDQLTSVLMAKMRPRTELIFSKVLLMLKWSQSPSKCEQTTPLS